MHRLVLFGPGGILKRKLRSECLEAVVLYSFVVTVGYNWIAAAFSKIPLGPSASFCFYTWPIVLIYTIGWNRGDLSLGPWIID